MHVDEPPALRAFSCTLAHSAATDWFRSYVRRRSRGTGLGGVMGGQRHADRQDHDHGRTAHVDETVPATATVRARPRTMAATGRCRGTVPRRVRLRHRKDARRPSTTDPPKLSTISNTSRRSDTDNDRRVNPIWSIARVGPAWISRRE